LPEELPEDTAAALADFFSEERPRRT